MPVASWGYVTIMALGIGRSGPPHAAQRHALHNSSHIQGCSVPNVHSHLDRCVTLDGPFPIGQIMPFSSR